MPAASQRADKFRASAAEQLQPHLVAHIIRHELVDQPLQAGNNPRPRKSSTFAFPLFRCDADVNLHSILCAQHILPAKA
jgi:hypothetical protein